jgi:hypothetical protein
MNFSNKPAFALSNGKSSFEPETEMQKDIIMEYRNIS